MDCALTGDDDEVVVEGDARVMLSRIFAVRWIPIFSHHQIALRSIFGVVEIRPFRVRGPVPRRREGGGGGVPSPMSGKSVLGGPRSLSNVVDIEGGGEKFRTGGGGGRGIARRRTERR